MKLKHHVWSSLVAGGTLWYLTGSQTSMMGALIGGVLIDADHIVDQLWSIRLGAGYVKEPSGRGANFNSGPKKVAWGAATRYLSRRKLVRLPLVFHSYELLLLLAVVTSITRTPFLLGLFTGYLLHLLLDLTRHHHEFRSRLFYLISYRLTQGFRRERLIKSRYL
jgi:hypothetical protein